MQGHFAADRGADLRLALSAAPTVELFCSPHMCYVLVMR